jgi:hypothetical protein
MVPEDGRCLSVLNTADCAVTLRYAHNIPVEQVAAITRRLILYRLQAQLQRILEQFLKHFQSEFSTEC